MDQPSTITLIGQVVLPGLLIVFLELIVLIAAVSAVGAILKPRPKQDNFTGNPPEGPSRESAPDAVQAVQEIAAGAIENISGAGQDTIAVISAAVAAVMSESAPGLPYAITSIRRPRELRPVWGLARTKRT